MRDLSLHLLDLVQNALVADSQEMEISYFVDRKKRLLSLIIKDNGTGMTPAQAAQSLSPFYSSRTTRKEGLGLPLFKMAAELTKGTAFLTSVKGQGTCVTGQFDYTHINMPPLGDTVGTLLLLIATNPYCSFVFHAGLDDQVFTFTTSQVKERLKDTLPLSHPDVQRWMREYLTEQLEQLWGKGNAYLKEKANN